MSEDKNRLRIPSSSCSREECECTIAGLTREESKILEGSILGGHHWIRRGPDDRLQHVPSYEPLPSVTDDEMLPFWRKPTVELPVQMEQFPHLNTNNYSPSITIQHLCGYNYSPEGYKAIATQLESYGFVCMRSQRGNDGKFREIWFLCGLWAAKGDLHNAIETKTKATRGLPSNDARELRVALDFLQRNSSFGTLDVSTQRMAMVVD